MNGFHKNGKSGTIAGGGGRAASTQFAQWLAIAVIVSTFVGYVVNLGTIHY